MFFLFLARPSLVPSATSIVIRVALVVLATFLLAAVVTVVLKVCVCASCSA